MNQPQTSGTSGLPNTTAAPSATETTAPMMSSSGRWMVLICSFLGLVFAGLQLGLMPLASLSVSKSLMGDRWNGSAGGEWFAWYTTAMMLGAAIGGILLGSLGDKWGRTRTLGLSVLFYSIAGWAGSLVTSQEQLLVLRFLTGLGVGGVWPNGVALVSECWNKTSRPMVSGIAGAGINVGIFLVSQCGYWKSVTPDSWRWLFEWSGGSLLLALVMLAVTPESPAWLLSQSRPRSSNRRGTGELFRGKLLQRTLMGILLGAIPLIGAWAAGKWMIPWADKVAGTIAPGYKATTQGYWAVGAILGSFFGSHVANLLGRRFTYFLISLGAVISTCGIFLFSKPLSPGFLEFVFVQAFISTLFFGWLPLYLPELFPTRVRAGGTGIAYNTGRFASAAGVLGSGMLLSAFGGDYARVGAITGLIYAVGMVIIWWAPDTTIPFEDEELG